jgi:hypothetical protein
MELSYRSLAQFYADLKAHLLGAGLTVEREVASEDFIFNIEGGFFRLQKKTISSSVATVGWAFGTNADVLAAQTVDAERIMPFALTSGGEMVPSFHWYAPDKWMSFLVSAYGHDGRAYRIGCNLSTKMTDVQHEDRFARQTEPNFKDSGAPYLPVGA